MPKFDVTLTVTLTDAQMRRLTREEQLERAAAIPPVIAEWIVVEILPGTQLATRVEGFDTKRTSVMRDK
jgi:hypothetical protein